MQIHSCTLLSRIVISSWYYLWHEMLVGKPSTLPSWCSHISSPLMWFLCLPQGQVIQPQHEDGGPCLPQCPLHTSRKGSVLPAHPRHYTSEQRTHTHTHTHTFCFCVSLLLYNCTPVLLFSCSTCAHLTVPTVSATEQLYATHHT